MKHWHIDDVAWDRFDAARAAPEIVPLVKAAALVERNGREYAVYLCRIFHDDPDFQQAARNWGVEEEQHGEALGRWARLADPEWDFSLAFQRYRAGYKLPLETVESVRGSRSGELIARCIVETGTSSYYTALAEATGEPVLKQVSQLIAADEYRHFKLFYDHMKRYLGRESISFPRRLRIAASRMTETEDDELSFAYHCANTPVSETYDHSRCLAAYVGGAMRMYRPHHIDRGMGMVFKAVGLKPQGRIRSMASWVAWEMLKRRRYRLESRQVMPRPRHSPLAERQTVGGAQIVPAAIVQRHAGADGPPRRR